MIQQPMRSLTRSLTNSVGKGSLFSELCDDPFAVGSALAHADVVLNAVRLFAWTSISRGLWQLATALEKAGGANAKARELGWIA